MLGAKGQKGRKSSPAEVWRESPSMAARCAKARTSPRGRKYSLRYGYFADGLTRPAIVSLINPVAA
jgi:hypothetical protein